MRNDSLSSVVGEVIVAGLSVHDRRWGWEAVGMLLMVGLVVALFYVPGMGAWLQYDRVALGYGQCWRLFTGHVTHWTAAHLFWDLLAFVILSIFAWRISAGRYGVCLLLASAAISITAWAFLPEMVEYRGLSGLDSALFVFVALGLLRERVAAHLWISREAWNKEQWGWAAILGLALVGFVGKTMYELVTGQVLFVQDLGPNVVPIPLVHVVGGVVGGGVALVGRRVKGSAVIARAV